ncbi:signal peptide peptidase [Melampsora americana]|nr:signal peptide peptidase [Melampsora americana]
MDTIYQAYVALGVSAVIPIWFASHASVKVPVVRKSKTKTSSGDDQSSSDEDEEEEVERMTSEDAYWFPVLGSGALLGLYLVFKYLNKDLINAVLSAYFALMGTGGLTTMLTTIIKSTLGPQTWSKQTKYKFRLTKSRPSDLLFSLRFTNWHLAFLFISAILSVLQWYTKQWILSNAFALSFAFNAITLLKLDSFKTGSVLLAGLFLYDIWWVFGSSHAFGESVMVSVAKNFDAPIKITWPRSLYDALSSDQKKFAMLGLGDIVMPGIFVALCLRYDYHLAYTKLVKAAKGPINKKTLLSPTSQFPRPYFHTCMASYVIGLATTMFVMHVFKAAQPALLYLSPACLGSVFFRALITGETAEYWRWEDGEDDEKKTTEEEEVKRKENEKKSTKDEENEEEEEVELSSTRVSESGKDGLRLTNQGKQKKKK